MKCYHANRLDRNLKRAPRSRRLRRALIFQGMESLEERQLLAFAGSAAPAWHPTSTDPLDVQSGPLANAGPDLIKVYQEYQAYKLTHEDSPVDRFRPTDTQIMSQRGMVGVEVSVYGDTAGMVKILSDASVGLVITASDTHYGLVDGYVNPANLITLAQFKTTFNGEVAGVVGVSPIFKPETNGSSTQAVQAYKLPATLQQYPGIDGTGVTLGILSDSVNQVDGGLSDSINAGALPPLSRITVIEDGPAYGNDEGRAMMEVAYDVAPGANFMFATAEASPMDMAKNILALSNAGCQVIVDDYSWGPREPVFQISPVEDAISTVVTTQNRVYFASAGNKDGHGYLSNFRAVSGTVGGITGTFQDFDPNGGVTTQLPVTVTSGGLLDFQYDQPWYTTGGVTSQVNIYFIDSNGTVVKSGIANNIASQLSQQVVDLSAFSGQTLSMAVQVASGAAPVHIMAYQAYNNSNMQFSQQFGNAGGTTYPTTKSHNAGINTIGVGAVNVRDIPPFSSNSPIPSEYFSSAGPRILVYDNNGNPIAGGTQVLQRPQISAPDAIQTTFFGKYVGNESKPSFFGTSCAAPDAAALAVLMRQLAPGATQQEILDAMITSTISINGKPSGPGNWDPVGGFGLIQAPKAFSEIAPPQAANLTAILNQGPTITLSWTCDNPKAISYTIQRFIGGVYTSIGTVNAPTTTFTDSTVQPGGQYKYIVLANSAKGPGIPSSSVTVAIPQVPDTPLDLKVMGVSTSWVLMSWSGVAPPVDGYSILRRTGQNPFVSIATIPVGAMYQYVDTNLTPGTTYDYQLVAYNIAGNSKPAGVTATTRLTAAVLPTPWVDSDIGAPSIPGAAEYSGGAFTVQTRSVDATATVDQLNFIHQTSTGDAVIIARVAELGSTSFWAKAGVMMRSSLDPTGQFVSATISPDGGSRFEWRPIGGHVLSVQGGPVTQAPAWVKLVREATSFFGYVSSDGSSWSLIARAQLNMPATVEVGLSVTSYSSTLFNTSKFDNVSVAKLDYSPGLAINVGGNTVGGFLADAYNTGGHLVSTATPANTSGVKHPAPGAVYQTGIQGTGFTYTIPNLTPGAFYQARLHFDEFVFGGAGLRQFNVSINGQSVLTNFDIFKTAGGMNRAIVEEFLTTADANGRVTIVFSEGAASGPLVNGIELVAKGLSMQAASLTPTVFNVFNGVVATFSSLDPQVIAGDFTASIDWGDGTTSMGTVAANPSGGFQVLGTHTYEQVNAFNFKVVVTGAVGETGSATGMVRVQDLSLSVTPQLLKVSEGVSLANTVLTTFITANPLSASSYLVSIDWGDGTTVDTTSGKVTQSGGVYSVSGVHSYAEQGVYQAKLIITVPGSAGLSPEVVPVAVPITVSEVPLLITPGSALNVIVGTPLTHVALATFTDPAGADDVSYYRPTIDWGDGTTSAGTVVLNGEVFTVLGSHIYQSPGAMSVVMRVQDHVGDVLGTSTLKATVNPIPLTGGLTAASDSGASNSDSITNVKAPTYQGTAPAGSTVTLALQPSSGSPITATAQADAAGYWTIGVPQSLSDGKYVARVSTAQTSSSLGTLCIDTAGAKVLSVQLLRSLGQVKLQIQDALGGLDPASLLNPALYSFVAGSSGGTSVLTAADIQVQPGSSPTSVQTVILKPRHGASLPATNYRLSLLAANQFDLAGNALDGKFNGKLPSGTGGSGSDFAALVGGSGNQTTLSAIGSSVEKGISPIPRGPKVVVHPQVTLPNGRVAQGLTARPQLVRLVPGTPLNPK